MENEESEEIVRVRENVLFTRGTRYGRSSFHEGRSRPIQPVVQSLKFSLKTEKCNVRKTFSD
jgi:hypothetical protein